LLVVVDGVVGGVVVVLPVVDGVVGGVVVVLPVVDGVVGGVVVEVVDGGTTSIEGVDKVFGELIIVVVVVVPATFVVSEGGVDVRKIFEVEIVELVIALVVVTGFNVNVDRKKEVSLGISGC